MKKGTKLGFGLAAVAIGAIALSGCTKSFCSQIDSARMRYAFEPGITVFDEEVGHDLVFKNDSNETIYTIKNAKLVFADWEPTGEHKGSFVLNNGEKPKKLTYLNSIIKGSRDKGYVTIDYNTIEYLKRFDILAYNAIFEKAYSKNKSESIELDFTVEKDNALLNDHILRYSYARFVTGNSGNAWKNWNAFNLKAREEITADSSLIGFTEYFNDTAALSPDFCPSSDYISYYKASLRNYVSAYRTCLTTKTDKYGTYGYEAKGVYIDKKSWGEAWSKGLFEGLLVFPIGWLVDTIVIGFRGTGVTTGVAAFLGIIFVTLIIRALMLLLTFKQTQSNAKMTELQPEITKIQNKYPNANTSQVEKQRMAEEMQRLYKKNKVNPFMTLIVLVVQFPVFICVWGALSGSASLTNGTILGLNLSHTIKDVLFNKAAWSAAGGYAAVTALFLFLLMAAAQTVSMLLPQWIQKRNAKKVAKLGKNPAQKAQNNKMKWFTYIMLALIIFMGFSLVSAMGIYWFIGAIFSIIQTIIMQVISSKKAKKKN